MFKVHVQVGGFDPRDPLLDQVWGLLAEAGTPVVVHAGSGPVAAPAHRAGAVRRGAAPATRGWPRSSRTSARRSTPSSSTWPSGIERVRWTPRWRSPTFFEAIAPFPRRSAAPAARPRPTGSLLGSDFPNIPYPYADQLEALERLDLGEDWLRAVCWENAAAGRLSLLHGKLIPGNIGAHPVGCAGYSSH